MLTEENIAVALTLNVLKIKDDINDVINKNQKYKDYINPESERLDKDLTDLTQIMIDLLVDEVVKFIRSFISKHKKFNNILDRKHTEFFSISLSSIIDTIKNTLDNYSDADGDFNNSIIDLMSILKYDNEHFSDSRCLISDRILELLHNHLNVDYLEELKNADKYILKSSDISWIIHSGDSEPSVSKKCNLVLVLEFSKYIAKLTNHTILKLFDLAELNKITELNVRNVTALVDKNSGIRFNLTVELNPFNKL